MSSIGVSLPALPLAGAFFLAAGALAAGVLTATFAGVFATGLATGLVGALAATFAAALTGALALTAEALVFLSLATVLGVDLAAGAGVFLAGMDNLNLVRRKRACEINVGPPRGVLSGLQAGGANIWCAILAVRHEAVGLLG